MSQLSRFERGQSGISLNKFLVALDRMHVEVKEFMDMASDFKKTEQICFMPQKCPKTQKKAHHTSWNV